MKIKHLFIALIAVAAMSCSTNKTAAPIKVKVPARPAGQENVIGLTVPAMDTVRVGFVGLGMRGSGAVPRFTYIPGVKINPGRKGPAEGCRIFGRHRGLQASLREGRHRPGLYLHGLGTSRSRGPLCDGARQKCSMRGTFSNFTGRDMVSNQHVREDQEAFYDAGVLLL